MKGGKSMQLHIQARAVVRAALVFASATFVDYAQAIYARSELGESPPPYCSVFHHMPKSAGSTIKSALETASLVDGVSVPPSCALDMDQDPRCIEGLDSSPVISGYAERLRGRLNESGRQCEYFTMMREPIDRLVSAFFYCPTDHDKQARPLEMCGYSPSKTPLTSRLLEFARRMWSNQAFRQMAYGMQCPFNVPCDMSQVADYSKLDATEKGDLLAEMRERLETYVAVGIVEYMDLSMDLFNSRVKSPVQDWTSNKRIRNPGQTSGIRDDVLEWARASPEIQRVLEGDLALYEYAVQIFKRQTTEALGVRWAD